MEAGSLRPESLESLRAQLNSWGIRLIATSLSLDTDQANPASRPLLHILGAVAGFEREMIRERVKTDMEAAKRKGTRIGRQEVTLDAKRARKLHKSGMSLCAIAAMLGVGRGTVQRLLAT